MLHGILSVITFSLKKCILPFSNRISLYELLLFLIKKIKKHGLSTRSSAISFNVIMAIPALLLLFIAITPYLPQDYNIKNHLLNFLKDITPNSSTHKFISTLIINLSKKKMGLISLLFPVVLFYSSNAMYGIIRSFNISINENKTYLFYSRVKAIFLTLIILVYFIITQVLIANFTELQYLFFKHFIFSKPTKKWILNLTYWIQVITYLFLLISIIFRYAPNVTKKWKFISYGAILATVGILFSMYIFYFWVNNYANYNKVYGSIGAVMILFFLIYLNAFCLLLGFEVNTCIYTLSQSKLKKEQLHKEN